jgi:GT2 family glycosyltransferase
MVTVIIINWNSGGLLRQCLNDLDKQNALPTSILVIDNGSSDESTDGLEEFLGVEVSKLGENHGFAGGNNRALEQVETEYVALLNADAFPEKDWLKNLLAAAKAFPEVAAFGSRQMMYHDDALVDGLGDIYHFSGLIWRQDHGVPLETFSTTPFEIFSPCAGAALYRVDALRDVGGFDEDFFCYLEDVDLGFRLRLAGYKAMLVPDAVVNHVGGAASGGKHSKFAVYHGHRNLVWAYVKNMPGMLFWVCLPLHILLNFIEIVWFVLIGRGSIIFKSKRDAIYGLPNMWQKRKQIQKDRSVSVGEIWRVLDRRLWPSKK